MAHTVFQQWIIQRRLKCRRPIGRRAFSPAAQLRILIRCCGPVVSARRSGKFALGDCVPARIMSRYTRDREGMDVAKAKVSVDDLVKTALQTVASTDGPLRMSGKAAANAPPALFPGASGANKEAIEQLTAAQKPLITVSGPKDGATITLTAAGFTLIADTIPEEKLATAVKGLAENLKAAERVAFLSDIVGRTPSVTAELLPLLKAAETQLEADNVAEAVTATAKKAREDASLASMEECKGTVLRLREHEISHLKKLLAVLGATVATTSELPQGGQASIKPHGSEQHPPAKVTKPLEPVTEEEQDFRRDVAERLVSSWRDAVKLGKAEAQGFLETALDNISGVQRVGEEGDEVPFDGALHEAIPGIHTDHPVRIVRSGWAIEEGEDRQYVIQKAQVAK